MIDLIFIIIVIHLLGGYLLRIFGFPLAKLHNRIMRGAGEPISVSLWALAVAIIAVALFISFAAHAAHPVKK